MNPEDRPGDPRGWRDCSYLLEPPESSVYRVRDRAGVIIYVGMTGQFIEERFGSYRHRHTQRQNEFSWWHLAASVDVMTVPAAIVRHVEALEIHEHHPRYNSQCYHCGQESWGGSSAYFYRIWTRLRREHWDRVHQPWRESLRVFAAEVPELIGPKPPKMVLRLVNSHGRWEPGNICWGRGGPYNLPR